jgi:anaerobic magnesium-protoporphyrin IX monomethyl ester cyclase
VILINAQSNRTEKLGVFARYVPLGIPVGIASLAACLIEKGHFVKLWDEAIRMLSIEDFRQLAEDCGKPYIFGISCLTASIFRGYTIARQIREIFPDAKIIFGGMHPTVLPGEVLNTGLVDYVIVKEGEVPLEKLYRALKGGQGYEDINNLSFRKNGRIIHNPTEPGPPMELLPPFPYHLFEKYMDRYHYGSVVGSRGCPFNCIFCSQRSITGRRFTARNSDRIVDDIELLVNKYNQHLVTFSDDNMLTNKRRMRELCGLIQERGLHKKAAFECQFCGDDINEEIIPLLKATL